MTGRRFHLVSLLGTSPGTPHTTACKLQEEGVEIEAYTIVATVEQHARQAAEILTQCPCPHTGKPPTNRQPHIILLPFTDVDTPEKLRTLRRTLSKLLTDTTILDVTGGRKIMAVAAALEALQHGASIVATILPDQLYDKIRRADKPCEKTAPQHAKLVILA